MSYKNTANQFGISNIFLQAEPGISIALADDRYINEDEGYRKKEVDTLVANKRDITDSYSKSEIDTSLSLKRNITDSYTKAEVNSLLEKKEDIVKQVNILPTLTSNSSDPSVLVTANHNVSTAFHVTDSNPETSWSSTEPTSSFIIKFIERPRKVVRIYLEGDIPEIWILSGSSKGNEWLRIGLHYKTSSDVNLLNDYFYSFYLLKFTGRVTIRKLQLFERQTIIKDLVFPTERLQATPKFYVDAEVEKLNQKLIKLGVKSYRGYIPKFDNKASFDSQGYKVVTPMDPGWYIFFNDKWESREKTNYWFEIQLPEAIRIWKFAIRGRLDNYANKANQPESIVLKGCIKGSSIYSDIFSTLNADLEPNKIKHFEVSSTVKYSVYRLHCNTSTAGTKYPQLSYFQLYPIEDIAF